MTRKLSARTLPTSIQPQQLNTTGRRTLRNQVNAMIRLAQRRLDDRVIMDAGHEGLQTLIQSFRDFALDYATILDNANQSGELSFLLHSGIERLLQEWSILSRVCEQRAETKPENMKKAEREESVRYYLEQADKRLAGYCRRWNAPQNAAYVQLKTPVVYFEKLYRISRALFALDIPVISIPLSDYDEPKRWQALAHEMGHHVFWNAVASDELHGLHDRLRQEVAKAVLERHGVTDYIKFNSDKEDDLLKRVELWGQWLEEVFADICGVLFAGPVFAHSAQDLAAASVNTPEDLIGYSDQAHPSLYLRPLISLEVVRILARELSNADYGEALLDWAGAGETRTSRRASGLEDYLQATKSADWPSGKRIPSDMPVGAAPSGNVYWQSFTRPAANSIHPAAQVTLDDLAGDVSVVVKTVLKARVWPEDRCLWDLIKPPYGPQSESETEGYLRELEDLRWENLPQTPGQHDFPPLPDLYALSGNNPLAPIMRRIVADMEVNHVEANERPRVFWTSLSMLDLEFQAAHYTPHGLTNNHYHNAWLRDALGQWHTHSADGATILWQ